MLNSVVIDVTIGIILIYLLYSLLASTIQETISSVFALRARTLAKGIERMLNDEPSTLRETFEHSLDKWRLRWERILSLFVYNKKLGRNTLSDKFYNEPLIKYQGASKLFRKPAYLRDENFAQALLQILLCYGNGSSETEKIKDAINSNGVATSEAFKFKYDIQKHSENAVNEIERIIQNTSILRQNTALKKYLLTERDHATFYADPYQWYCNSIKEYQKVNLLIEPDTRKQLTSFYEKSGGDLDKFQHYLETWFNDTMNRVSGWYKKGTQKRLFFYGIVLAIAFNIDTFKIVDHLSHDEKARKEAADLATSYYNSNKNLNSADSGLAKQAYQVAVKSSLNDIQNASNTFSLFYPWQISDTLAALNKRIEEKYASYTNARLYGNNALSQSKDPLVRHYFELQKARYQLGLDTSKSWRDSLTYVISTEQKSFNALLGAAYVKAPKVWSFWEKAGYVFSRLLSFIVTAVAISLGAPFWFDLLNKFVNLRGTGAKPEDLKKDGVTDKTKTAAG